MALTDLPLDQLRTMTLDAAPPADLEEFWRNTITEAREHPLLLERSVIESPLRRTTTWDLTFGGFDGQPIKAWLQLPADADGPLATVVEFHGYSGSRGVPLASSWVDAGYAHLQMDSRGQGWYTPSLHDLTPDWGADVATNGAPGLMTRGASDPQTYYFRRLITDAVRLVELAASLDEVDQDRIAVHGGSQGGALTIAAAGICALTGTPVAAAMPDVPFLCSIERAIDVATAGPYPEVEAFLKARPQDGPQILATLNYVDGVHLGRWATCPALFSVALRDPICPPSTVFQAFNAWGGTDTRIEVCPWNGHEGGREIHTWKQLDWLAKQFG